MNNYRGIPRPGYGRRALGAMAVLAVAALLGGCDNLLDVKNPGAITEDGLNDASMISAIVAGAVGEFQPAISGAAFYGGVLTDELNDYQVFIEDRPIDLRDLTPSSGLVNTYVYTRLQRARGAADKGVDRLQAILGDKAGSSLDVARLLDYAGYSYVLLAESFCSAPIDLSAAHSPDELFQMARDRFDQALTIAAAARAAGADAASADSLTNLANVGAARAALDMGDMSTALQHAQAVPADFEFWSVYSDNSSREWNSFYDAVRSGNQYLSIDPSFLGLHDPRIPQDSSATAVPFNVTFFVWIPYQPYSYSGWNGTPVPIGKNASFRFASGLEARYIAAEAQGPTAATLAFVNERRAVGNEPPVDDSGDQLMAELREQRRRDFFLAAYRLGDLRRYMKLYDVDQFPTGVWPGSQSAGTTLTYSNGTCFPIPTTEVNGNPNLQ